MAQDNIVADETPFDPRTLRRLFGQFASGVTVVLSGTQDDVHGMTANSFTSVSLDPPLVLISVGNQAHMHRIIADQRWFSVNILSAQQEDLSRHFAGQPSDGGRDLPIVFDSAVGMATLAGSLAHVACALRNEVPLGDHTLFIGEVIGIDGGEGAPLVFYGGRYRHLADGDTNNKPKKTR